MAVDSLLHVVSAHGGAATSRPSSLPHAKTSPQHISPVSSREAAAKSCPYSPSLAQIIQRAAGIALSYRDARSPAPPCREARRLEQKRQILKIRMNNAESAAQWEEAARELDKLEGNDAWKNDDATGEYSASLIESRLQQLDAARANWDIREMLFLIRNTLSRDLGGMGSADLYRHSYTGTKRIIERYVESAVKTIEALVERTAGSLPEGMRHQDVLAELIDTRQNFGRSALMLSGGATYGMTHIGVVKALFEAKLLPRVISGASAGSIICAVLCTKTDEEIPTVLATFPYGDLNVFEEEGNEDSFASRVRNFLTEGSWSTIQHLTRVMRGLLGDITFREAYNRTRRICNITVSTASVFELPRLLNYYTAPDVMIWSAVVVSCSVPLLFQASSLLIKDPITGEHLPWNPSPQRWIDGSVDNDLPTARLSEMFSVNHFIVSQVNPHVIPFLPRDNRPLTLEERAQIADASDDLGLSSLCGRMISKITALAKDEALYRLNFAAEVGIFPNLFTKLCSIISQKYSGDITIIPEISFQDLPRILKNPTTEFMVKSCLIGEKATWPQLRRIRDHCAIELAIDRAIHDLRTRAAFSPSQVNLRLMGTVRSGEVGQPITKLHHRERRRSGGSLQLLVRQHQNRGEVEQIMTGNESRLGDGESDSGVGDEEDDEGILELDTRRGRSRKQRQSSSSSSIARGTAAATTAAASPKEIGGSGLLKPVLRRATRSHNALPLAVRSKLSTAHCVSPGGYDPGALPDIVDNYMPLVMTSFALGYVCVDSPVPLSDSRAQSPSLGSSSLGSLSPPPTTGGSRVMAAGHPFSPPPSPSLLHLHSPRAPTPPSKKQTARFEIASPTDDTTLGGDSSVFDGDGDAEDESQSESNSVSDPDLHGGPTGRVGGDAATDEALKASLTLDDDGNKGSKEMTCQGEGLRQESFELVEGDKDDGLWD